jgi:hypothetical protein
MDEVQREIEALTREVEAAPLKERVRLRTALHHKEEERDNLYIRLKEANRVTEGTLGPNVTNPDVDLNAVNEVTNTVAKPTLKERRTQNRQTRKQKKVLRNMINRMTVREAALDNFKTRKARNAERLNLRLAELELQKHQDRLALVKRRMEEERTRKERDPEITEDFFRHMKHDELNPEPNWEQDEARNAPEPNWEQDHRTQDEDAPEANKIAKEPLHKRLFKGVRL